METDSTTLNVLRLLAVSPRLSQREVASTVGVSVGKVNYCLRALICKGLVKAKNYRKSSNRLAYLYLLTPAGVAAKADLTRRFLARKVKEYEALRQEIEELKSESEFLSDAE
ncbi:MAG: MarR family EPS-associated transcriptional regulator [Chloroflexi bacterium]|nr:MarR family EPS-associated transcriptional regulator [Chloroflexota bacterium]